MTPRGEAVRETLAVVVPVAREAPVAALWRVYGPWVAAHVLGGALALSLGDLPSMVGLFRGSDLSDTSGWSEAWAVVIGGLLAGAALGGAQWLVLRRLRWWTGIGARRWVLASAGALAIGYPIVWLAGGGGGSADFAHHALPHVLDPAGYPGGAVLGALVGLAQAVVLGARPEPDGGRSAARRGVWVAVSVAGFVLGWLVAVLVPSEGPEAHLIGGAAFGLAYAAATAAAVWPAAAAARNQR